MNPQSDGAMRLARYQSVLGNVGASGAFSVADGQRRLIAIRIDPEVTNTLFPWSPTRIADGQRIPTTSIFNLQEPTMLTTALPRLPITRFPQQLDIELRVRVKR